VSVGSSVNEREILDALERAGFSVDDGCRIGGPFIPDGTTRIYDEDTTILSEGETLAEAVENLPDSVRGRASL